MMVNTPRGNRGRFVKASTSAGKAASHSRNSIKSYFSAVTPAQSSSLLSSPLTIGDQGPSNTTTIIEVPDSIGRPPTKLSLQPNDEVQETTNGVITVIDLDSGDLEESSKSATKILQNALTKNQEQAGSGKTKESEKRTLRSKDSSRVTSDLTRFFADYDDVVFGPPKEPEFLTPNTVLFVIDKKLKTQPLPIPQIQSFEQEHKYGGEKEIPRGRSIAETLNTSTSVSKATPTLRVDLSIFEQQIAAYTEDPLADSVYIKPHKRAERKEKQLRNIEKEHALHEKADLERILEDLQGSEWLRAMGIIGASDTDRKRYLEHRDHFIARVKALLSKFTAWKEQEKELRIRKEEAQAVQEDDDEDADDSGLESLPSSVDDSRIHQAVPLIKKITLRLTPKVTPAPEPQRPFVSFYPKPHLREAALAGHRRGRSITAFGLPLPDILDQEFTLPDGFVSEEAIIANARKRRRLKRENQIGGQDA